jgi:hypothetical protein
MTYSLTSSKFTGEVLFTYNPDQLLIKFDIKADMTRDQIIWLLKWIPGNYNALLDWKKKYDHLSLVEFIETVTFEMFWDAYDDKVRSSKKKALKIWVKLATGDQVKAYNYIKTYNRNRGTAEKKYAETYLNAELWNN